MSDFSPATRNASMWSGDSRKIANGKANEVILTKQGKMEIEDLSDKEFVQMGHVMEPVIASLASQKLGVELTKIEESLSHKKHKWMASHFDFGGTENGKTILVECKNYGVHQRNRFDDVANSVPSPDLAQLIHEAAVFEIDRIYLAVLFGGSEFVMYPFDITDHQKDQLIQQLAVVWGHVQAGTTMPPESVDQCKLLYPQDVPGTVKMASQSVEQACALLRSTKEQIKALEAQEEQLQTLIQGYMETASSLQSIDGSVLATWKNAKNSKRFDSKLFQQSMPDIYDQFVMEAPGSRRFLIK